MGDRRMRVGRDEHSYSTRDANQSTMFKRICHLVVDVSHEYSRRWVFSHASLLIRGACRFNRLRIRAGMYVLWFRNQLHRQFVSMDANVVDREGGVYRLIRPRFHMLRNIAGGAISFVVRAYANLRVPRLAISKGFVVRELTFLEEGRGIRITSGQAS